jgi:hypothetical protein
VVDQGALSFAVDLSFAQVALFLFGIGDLSFAVDCTRYRISVGSTTGGRICF